MARRRKKKQDFITVVGDVVKLKPRGKKSILDDIIPKFDVRKRKTIAPTMRKLRKGFITVTGDIGKITGIKAEEVRKIRKERRLVEVSFKDSDVLTIPLKYRGFERRRPLRPTKGIRFNKQYITIVDEHGKEIGLEIERRALFPAKDQFVTLKCRTCKRTFKRPASTQQWNCTKCERLAKAETFLGKGIKGVPVREATYQFVVGSGKQFVRAIPFSEIRAILRKAGKKIPKELM